DKIAIGLWFDGAHLRLLTVLAQNHTLVAAEPVLCEDLLAALQCDSAVGMERPGVLSAVRNVEADFVMDEAFDEILLSCADDPAIHFRVVRLGPKVFGSRRMSAGFQ